MTSENRVMSVSLLILSTLVVCLQGEDMPVTEDSNIKSHSGTFKRSIWNIYNDKPLVADLKTPPVQFEIFHEELDMLRIDFNCSTVKNAAMNKNYTPEAFGMMFLGEKDRYVAFEVEKSDKSEVHIYDGFHNMLMPKQQLQISSKSLVSDNDFWNCTIKIPLHYFPRAVKQMCSYANFTEHPSDAKFVLSMKGKMSDAMEPMPDLQKPEYFVDVQLKDQMSKLDFDKLSPLWEDALGSSDGSSAAINQTTDTSDHQAHTGNGNNTATISTPLLSLVSFSAMMLTLRP